MDGSIESIQRWRKAGVTIRVVIRSITASYTKGGFTKDILSKDKTTTGRYKIATPHE